MDHLMEQYGADFYQKRGLKLDSAVIDYSCNTISRVRIHLSVDRILSHNEARKLIIDVAHEIQQKIQRDPLIQEKKMLHTELQRGFLA